MDSEASYQYIIKNPLDLLEEIIITKHWPCNRTNKDELISEIKGNLGAYRIYFAWSEEINAVSLTISFDMKVHQTMRPQMNELLSLINENLWIGHFDITSKSGIPAYRNTYLFREKSLENLKILEDILEIGISECERFYPAFQMVLWEDYTAREATLACLMETKGNA